MQQQAVEALVRAIKTLMQKNLVLLHKTNTIIISQFKKQSQAQINNHNQSKQEEWTASKQVMEHILQFTKIQHYKSFTNYIKAVANAHRLKYPQGQKFNLKRIYHKGRAANQRLFLITIPKQYMQFSMINSQSQQQAQQKYFNTAENSENFQSISQEIEMKQEQPLNDIQQNHRKDSEISLHNALKEQKQQNFILEKGVNLNNEQKLVISNQQIGSIEQSRNILTKRLQQLMSQENFDQMQEGNHQIKTMISKTLTQLLSFYKTNSQNKFQGREKQKLQISQEILQKYTQIYDRMSDNIQKIGQILNAAASPQSMLYKKEKQPKYQQTILSSKQLDVKKQSQQGYQQN